MTLSRRAFGLSALFGISAALSVPAGAEAGVSDFDLQAFFEGRTRGEGQFVSDLLGVKRGLVVDTVGKRDGESLILTEHIVYDDGQKETAVWRFQRTGSGFAGRRTGVTGVVPISVRAGVVEMSYVAEVLGPSGSKQKLRFNDRIIQTDPRTVLNTAKVSYLGIPVGGVEITFKKR